MKVKEITLGFDVERLATVWTDCLMNAFISEL